MAKNTVILIILSGIIALSLAVFQYFFKNKTQKKGVYILAVLRFVSIFAVLLLFLNPTFKNVSYTTVKPVLALAVDNSYSIDHLGYSAQVKKTLNNLTKNNQLTERFDIDLYSFGSKTSALDSLNFGEGQTDVAQVFQTFGDIYKQAVYVPLLITDGNSNLGADYSYLAKEQQNPIYLLAAGDTTKYDDLSVDRLNVNRYAYFKNEFPVEVFSSYDGQQEIKTQFIIRKAGRVVYKENATYNAQKRSHVFKTFLSAGAIGVQQYTAELTPIPSEKNTTNNYKNFAVDVIDQNTKVLIIYSVLHPDLGALKKSVQSNQLRTVDLKQTPIEVSILNDYDFVVLYQPDGAFQKVFDELKKLNKNISYVRYR